ncbi:MAG: aminodeoxychorismate synthase component I [Denitrovibrio sp.]|nr:MAG: aminodeoxychorismate synthase component I [Denitrovibrio sp.]
MHSAVLESFEKKDFLNFVRAVSGIWETDALFSGAGYTGENVSVCYILPISSYAVTGRESVSGLRRFINSDDKETYGFLAYDLGLSLKDVHTDKKLMTDPGLFKKYAAYARHCGQRLTIESDCPVILEKALIAYETYSPTPPNMSAADVKCNMTRQDYVGKVKEVIEYIRDGHTYQLNLSMMFEAETYEKPYDIWAHTAEMNPAPFYALFKFNEGHILSTSPERFIKVSDRKVLSQPIKGTLRFKEYYPELEQKLTESVKESAELSMIVDLIRNDISETCEVGSVEVLEHKSVMCVDDLLQMYSSVCGTLKDGKDVLDLLFSAFPGGSVTGCPKKRSMELIDSLEPHSRGVYC